MYDTTRKIMKKVRIEKFYNGKRKPHQAIIHAPLFQERDDKIVCYNETIQIDAKKNLEQKADMEEGDITRKVVTIFLKNYKK